MAWHVTWHVVQVASSEPMAAVKCAALRGLATVLGHIRSLPASDGKIFTECAANHPPPPPLPPLPFPAGA